MTTDAISTAIHLSLNGLSERQRVTSDNISNIQTPGFLAKTTDFESSLQSALNGRSATVRATPGVSGAPTRTDGNNVDLDNETIAATETELRYQTMIQAMNVKFRILRQSIG